MLGAIIGDIVGSRFEFNPTNDYNFPLFDERCSITDDSVCTCAVADAIMNGRNYVDSFVDWCLRYPEPQGGYGGGFFRWIYSRDHKPYNSFGNGSAMRVSSVAWLYYTDGLDAVLKAAKESAEITHNHPEGIKGACATAMAIYLALHGKSAHEVADMTCERFGYAKDIDVKSIMNYHDITCQGTMPVALWCIRHSHNYEDALRRAIALGVDADTIGAIVGSIAEALWGIPDKFIVMASVLIPDDMANLYTQFQNVVSDKIMKS